MSYNGIIPLVKKLHSEKCRCPLFANKVIRWPVVKTLSWVNPIKNSVVRIEEIKHFRYCLGVAEIIGISGNP